MLRMGVTASLDTCIFVRKQGLFPLPYLQLDCVYHLVPTARSAVDSACLTQTALILSGITHPA